jgi:thymidine kinase
VELLHYRDTCAQVAGRRVAIIKSDKDTRYSAMHVTTHDGVKRECHAVPTLQHFTDTVGSAYHSYDVFAIDEAQFFPDLIPFCITAADQHKKHVVLAGLDGDFKRQPFGQVRQSDRVSLRSHTEAAVLFEVSNRQCCGERLHL